MARKQIPLQINSFALAPVAAEKLLTTLHRISYSVVLKLHPDSGIMLQG